MKNEYPTIEPIWVRMKDAPAILTMNKNQFNDLVRPYLTEIPIGIQGIAFIVLEIKEWAAEYVRCVGRPGTKTLEELKCQNEHQV